MRCIKRTVNGALARPLCLSTAVKESPCLTVLALKTVDARRAELPRLHERGYQALAIMELHLKSRAFFVAETYGIADIALYAYTHAAADGGFSLQRYPAILAWLARVESQPRFLRMPSQPVV